MTTRAGSWLTGRLPSWPSRDPYLLLLTFVLPLGGVVLVASARVPVVLGGDSVFERVSVQQMVLAGVGVALALGLSAVNYQRFARIAPFGLLGVLIALVGVLFVEDATNLFAARRWFRIGGFTLQPSEFAKVAMVVMLAAVAQHYGGRIREIRVSILLMGGVVAVVVLPIVLEPDLGAAITIAFVGFVMIFAAGARIWHLLLGFGALVPVALLSISQNSYQRERLLTYLSGDPDVTRTGYQAAQAQIAMGSGGITGRGLGLGTQKFRLPIPDSDAVFAVLGEEFGFVGTGLLLVLFLALFVRGVQIAAATDDVFGRLLAIGIVTQLCFQAFVNMAVVTGLTPVTGITLPFISRGGSSLLASMIMMGILMNVARQSDLGQRE
jgi:cell division protein FtsW